MKLTPAPSPLGLAEPQSAAATQGLGASQAVAGIDELSRALHCDPDLVFEYIRENIGFTPTFGSKKSALGVVLDGHGNAFGQAKLMIELLRATGCPDWNARFVIGDIEVDQAKAHSWLGASDLNAAAFILASGAIPVYAPAGGVVRLTHVWVRITIDEVDYDFDPSLKTHEDVAGLDLDTVLGVGCDASGAITASGATVIDDSIQSLNDAALEAHLAACTSNLIEHLRTSLPSATLEDLVSGRRLARLTGVLPIRDPVHPNLAAGTTPATEVDVPATYRATLTVSGLGLAATTFYADEVSGERLTLSFNAANEIELRREGVLLATGQALLPGEPGSITLDIDEPYSGGTPPGTHGDQNGSLSITGSSTYHILNGWGRTGRGLVEHHRKRLEEARFSGAADDSETVLGETLAMAAALWLSQASSAASIVSSVASSIMISHHAVGLAGYAVSAGSTDGAPFVDIPLAFGGPVKLLDGALDEDGFFTTGAFLSVLESTTMDQLFQEDGASTISLFDLANELDIKIFQADSVNWPVVRAQLVNYGDECPATSIKCKIEQTLIDPGFTVFLPGDAHLTRAGEWDWQGYTSLGLLVIETQEGVTLSGSYQIGEASGGYATVEVAPTPAVDRTVATPEPPTLSGWYNGVIEKSADPISLFSGDFLYGKDDLSVGSLPFPHGLGFQRLYSSGARLSDRGMGLGWRHNFDITATRGSDGLRGMGESAGLDAAAFVVAVKIAHDLYAERDLDNVVVASLVQHWAAEQLTDNTVTVSQPEHTEQFVALPDGTFATPPRSSARLTESGGLYTYETVHGDALSFDANGKLATWSNANGFEVTLSYGGPNGALDGVSNDFGRTLTLGYADGRVSSVSDGTRSASFGYTGDDLSSATDPRGHATTYAYDLPGRMTELFMPARPQEAFVSNLYDGLGRVMAQTNAASETYEYFFAGTRSEERDPLGDSTVRYYDHHANVYRFIDKLARVTTHEYDGLGRRVASEFPEGNRIEMDYDDGSCASAAARCTHNIEEIRAIAKPGSGEPTLTRSFTYEGEEKLNKVKTATDAMGEVTTFDYDASGNLLSVTGPDPDGGGPKLAPVTTRAYYASGPTKGFLERETDPTNRSVLFVYDPASGDLTEQIADPGGLALKSCFVYDGVGNLRQSADPRFTGSGCAALDALSTTELAYDENRNLIETERPDPDGPGPEVRPITKVLYDEENQPVETRARVGTGWQKVVTTYNARRALERVYRPVLVANEADPIPAATAYAYTLYDELERVFETGIGQAGEADERRTQTSYYADGRAQEVRSAVGTALEQVSASFTYTLNGQVETLADANGNLTTHEYDGHDRLVKTRYPDAANGTVSSSTDFESFTYDANGNRLTHRLRSGESITLVYDALDRLISTDLPGTTPDVAFDYDAAGRRAIADVAGLGIAYGFDSVGRLETASADGRQVLYGYDAADNLSAITWPAAGGAPAMTVDYGYDALGQVASITEGANLLATYTYDELSRRKSVTRLNETVTTYEYDTHSNLESLTQEVEGGADDVTFGLAYNSFDELTQRTTSQSAYQWSPSVAATDTYSPANGLNQLTEVGGASAGYDANGNLTAHPPTTAGMPQPALTLGYDAVNRPISASVSGTPVATYAYDGEGRRASKTLTGGQTLEYLYTGERLIAEYDGAGGALLRRIVPGPGVDEAVVLYTYDTQGALLSRHYLHTDQQGSVVAVSDAAGAVVEKYTYGPYGEMVAGGALPPEGLSPFRYTGQLWDAETGLHYYKARYYSSALGQFVSPDPLGVTGGFNLYAYVSNDPVNFIDPSGLILESAINRTSAAFSLAKAHAQHAAFVTADFIERNETTIDVSIIAVSAAIDIATIPSGEGILIAAGGRAAVQALKSGLRRVGGPRGRFGNATTRAKTQEVIDDLRRRGFTEVATETRFRPGALASGKTRFADVTARNPQTGASEVIQIGRTLRSDPRIPVIRERRALDDIIFSPDLRPNSTIRFVDVNRPGVIQP